MKLEKTNDREKRNGCRRRKRTLSYPLLFLPLSLSFSLSLCVYMYLIYSLSIKRDNILSDILILLFW